MRLQHSLVSLLFAFSCAERLSGRHGVHIRQNDNEATATDAPSTQSALDSQTPTITESASRTASTSEETESFSGSDRSDVTSPITTSGRASATATATESAIPAVTDAPDTDDDELPIQPRITPALGVGGVILMIAGLALGFVGIKHRATQTFLSTALLVALGCEVLIIYLMNPPISDAVQGAFLVAGVVGGCLLGGVALVFKEISEGFGCILGGFSFAMWLLVLVPGGTIQNQPGRIILLSVFCAACFCLYLSRYTRVYGIIICTAFAGATAFIIGIDCFARAGLKEFWLYIWDLNEDIFPLFTETYPITKNMRAEIAGIVIVAFFGTMSQIKIWKIVKESKSKRDAERRAYEESREAEEAELGRGIEERNKRDRAEWEGTYDDQKVPHTNVQSTISIDAYGKATSELDLTNNTRYGDRRVSFPLVKLRPATKDENGRVTVQRMSSVNSLTATDDNRTSAVPSMPTSELDQGEDEASRSAAQVRRQSSESLATPGSPTHGARESVDSAALRSSVALPPPEGGDWDDEQDRYQDQERDGKQDGEQDGNQEHSVPIRRLSSMSLAARDALEANEEPFEPVEEDLASSVAATAAEPPDVDALSVIISRPASMFQPQGADAPPQPVNEHFIEEDPQPVNEQFIEEDEEALNLTGKGNLGESTPKSTEDKTGYFDITPDVQEAPVQDSPSEVLPVQTSLSEKLPVRMSKAALKYRTNEWAKEVGRAEPEPIEEVADHTLDAVQIESSNAADAARAEENNAAPPPPPPPAAAAPKPAVKPAPERRRSGGPNPYRQSKRVSRTPSNAALAQVQNEDEDDGWSVPLGKRRSSNSVTTLPAANMTTATLSHEQAGPSARNHALSAMSSMPNLLDERRDMIGRRITTTSFMVPTIDEDARGTSIYSKGADGQSISSNTKQPSSATSIREEDDDEDMTLAQRKALVQAQQQEQQQQNYGYTNFEPADRSLSRQTSNAFMPRSLSRQGSQALLQGQALSRQPSLQMLQSRAEASSPPPGLSRQPSQQLLQSRAGATSPPPAMRMSGGIIDSHQPRRMSSHDSTRQAMNWSAWRSSSALDVMQQEPVVAYSSQMDMLRAMRAQSEAEAKQRKEHQKAMQAQMDAHMRMGGMNDAHRAALSRMQGKANAQAQ